MIIGSERDIDLIRLAENKNLEFEIFNSKTSQNLIDAKIKYEWLLSLWNPHILSMEILSLAEHRLNLHPGLVPQLPGMDMAAWAVRKNMQAGVSLLEMDGGIDSADVYIQKVTEYEFPITGNELYQNLCVDLIELFKNSWPDILSGKIKPVPQVGEGQTYTRRMTNEDRVILEAEKMCGEDFARWALAHDFYPATTAEIKTEQNRFAVRVMSVENDRKN